MKKFLIILLTFTSLITCGQSRNGFEIKTGYGSYAMKDLSADLHYNKDKLRNDVDIKVINDFPPYLNFGLNWFIEFDRFEFGAGYTFLSTGGRVHYKDYSGEVGLEHLFKCHSLSGIARYNFIRKEKFKVDFTTQISYNLSLLKTSAWSRVGTDEDRVNARFTSGSAGVTAMVGAKYYFTSQFYGGGRVGAFLDTKAILRSNDDHTMNLVDHTGKDMKSDWTGWRTEVFVGYRFW